MNVNDPKHPWARLTAAARTVKDERDVAAPYGFATRVSARAFATPRGGSLIEQLALRALGVACLLTIGTVATNFSVVSSLFNGDESTLLASTGDDPVAELVDAAADVTID